MLTKASFVCEAAGDAGIVRFANWTTCGSFIRSTVVSSVLIGHTYTYIHEFPFFRVDWSSFATARVLRCEEHLLSIACCSDLSFAYTSSSLCLHRIAESAVLEWRSGQFRFVGCFALRQRSVWFSRLLLSTARIGGLCSER